MTKILIIEDDPMVRENLEEILELAEFDFLSAVNGAEGLAQAKEARPDLILCDVMMPEMNGFEVLENLRKDPHTLNIPLIFLTAKVDVASLREGMNLGADDYIMKPFDINSLLEAIQARLAKQANLVESVQSEMSDFRNRMTRALPQKFHGLLSQLTNSAHNLKEFHEHLTEQEIEDIADKIELTSAEIHHLFINFALYSQLELIALNPKARQAYENKRGSCLASVVLTQVSQSKGSFYRRSKDLKLVLTDTRIAIAESNFRKIAEELIDNAFKFSAPGTQVEIREKIDDHNWSVFIIDGGDGIEPALLAALFPEQSSDNLEKFVIPSFGLPIAKSLTELNGGTFYIESLPGKQTIIHLTFPIAR
ncbi:MAG: response regulator [Cyanobacteria bacterium RI_101]|nr:response regulator [Cyanobacteria bacterium RI_101]